MTVMNENEPSDIELLLPWHAAGTLSRRDSQRVEAALASDPELSRRYQAVCEELGQTIHINETLGAPSPRAMETLFARIAAEPARRSRVSLNPGARLRGFFAELSPRTLAWSAAAAALAIVLQTGVIAGVVLEHRAQSYEAASVPPAVAVDGVFALVRFRPEATAAAVAEFMESNKLAIAAGPSGGGLYRVRIAAVQTPKAELDAIVKRLQEAKVVAFIALTP